jgi:hypothetical protein
MLMKTPSRLLLLSIILNGCKEQPGISYEKYYL